MPHARQATTNPADDALHFLWYLPNTVESGHRGDDTKEGWGTLDFSAAIAQAVEDHHMEGALVGTGWGRPDTFTLCTALAARTTRFRPLAAVRPGYWQPAHFASAAATLDQLSEGRLLINIVSGMDNPHEYGDFQDDPERRYARTREFMLLCKRLWTEEKVSFAGEFYRVEGATCAPRPRQTPHPPLYFGGASAAAEQVAAELADVQLLWGEPLALAAERIERLRLLAARAPRQRALEFGLRITVVARPTSAEAWQAAERKLGGWTGALDRRRERNITGSGSVGQARLAALQEQGAVLDRCLWTAPARTGTGAASTWLVGSYDEVAASLRDYAALGMRHFILSDTPYLEEAARIGDEVVRRVRGENSPHRAAARPLPEGEG